MIDHHEGRLRDYHRAFGAWLLDLIGQARQASEALVAIQYAEPWKDAATPGSASPRAGLACECPA